MSKPSLSELYDWANFNKKELVGMLLAQGHRVKTSLSKERLVNLITTLGTPAEDELNLTIQTRARLEEHIHLRYGKSFSQLPCRGAFTQGKCTKHSCSDARHNQCWLDNESDIL